MFNHRSFGKSLAGIMALIGHGLIRTTGPGKLAPLPPVITHRHGMPRDRSVNMYDLSRAGRQAKKAKQYPFQSERQIARYRANYGCDENGTIISVPRALNRQIKSMYG